MYIPRKFRDAKKYKTSQEELNVVRKNDLNNLQLECEIRKLRKNNLLESSANQGKTTEKKLSEKKLTSN